MMTLCCVAFTGTFLLPPRLLLIVNLVGLLLLLLLLKQEQGICGLNNLLQQLAAGD
jgi:hypothetical protein